MTGQGTKTVILRALEAEREQDFAIIAEMRAAFKAVPDEGLERVLDRVFIQARKKHRKRGQRMSGTSGAGCSVKPME